MIELKNVIKDYDRRVLNNISIKFPNKGLISILGDSGSGKSTLLNIIAGYENPDDGNIYINNSNIDSYNTFYYKNDIVGYIFQNYNLIEYLSVIDNILLGVSLSKKKVKKLEYYLGKLNISHLKNVKVKYLSGGEKQRVAILRCIFCGYKVILADEPTGALDSANSEIVMKILKDISKDRLVIMVTHNMYLAKRYSDNILQLNDGIINGNMVISDIKNTSFNKYIPKLNLRNKIKYSFNNLLRKKVRFLLMIIAVFIGIFGVGFILAINNGFNRQIDELKKNILYDYPLIINNEISVNNFDNDSELLIGNYKVKESNYVRNDLDQKLLNMIESLSDYLNGIAYYKDISYEFNNISYVNPSNSFFDLIEGEYPKNKNEVLLLVDSDLSISKNVISFLNVDNEEVINKNFIIDGKKFKVVGIVKSNHNYFMNLNGILYDNNAFSNKIVGIHLYPKDYKSKEIIKDKLSDYYIDDSMDESISLLSKFVSGITLILLVFSFVSILITSIMIIVISYISVLEREKEIGVFKSLGMTNRDVKSLFLFDNYLLAFVSFVFSIISMWIIGNTFNKYVNFYLGIDNLFKINCKIIIFLFVLSLFLCFISGIIPAIIASKRKIVDIIRG